MQDTTEPWEVLVVLDRVHDESPAVIDAFRDRLPLRALHSPAPHGVVAALNVGYDQARGRVLIRCDDDLTPAPDMVRRHVAHHRGRDDVGVSCAMRDVPSATAYWDTYGREAAARRTAQWYDREPDRRWVDWSAHNSVTRTAWSRLDHGFDPRFVYGQDSELGFRLARSGVRIVVDPALEIEHRGAPLSAANRVPRAYVAGASRSLFQRVHGEAHEVTVPLRRGLRTRAWDAGTALTAAALTEWRHYELLGRGAESASRRLPPNVGRRVVAFCVESAGRAGRRHGSTDLSTYRPQKSRELQRERPATG
ncbi:glycosyl transferase family 2 [Phycicoccus duodecadis]|uniref:Glycosyl transferase family 2 n=1 Tax=Phycicoccus duodecadis TaxID=173053 RepID=A0A2N3YJM8_9MICO|nr:glycosyl transferase family 2 [Phycicoccus duodecadis]